MGWQSFGGRRTQTDLNSYLLVKSREHGKNPQNSGAVFLHLRNCGMYGMYADMHSMCGGKHGVYGIHDDTNDCNAYMIHRYNRSYVSWRRVDDPSTMHKINGQCSWPSLYSYLFHIACLRSENFKKIAIIGLMIMA